MKFFLPTERGNLRRWGLVCLFLLALLPRALYPVSRPLQWYMRSAEFWDAVLRGDWAGTLLSEHPGVSVMWLSGGALWGWHALQSALGLPSPPPLETEGYAFADRVAVGVIPLALVVAAGIVWGWHLLRRLFGERAAWTAALLWAIDPFFLANSKVLHLDATLSTLMLLSALCMLIYLRERERKPLIVSALLGGLAILTKVTALYLVPFLGLCLLGDWISALRTDDRPAWVLRSSASHFVLWVAIAAGTCGVLWPSLWVRPRASCDTVVGRGRHPCVAATQDRRSLVPQGTVMTAGVTSCDQHKDQLGRLCVRSRQARPFVSLSTLGTSAPSARRSGGARAHKRDDYARVHRRWSVCPIIDHILTVTHHVVTIRMPVLLSALPK